MLQELMGNLREALLSLFPYKGRRRNTSHLYIKGNLTMFNVALMITPMPQTCVVASLTLCRRPSIISERMTYHLRAIARFYVTHVFEWILTKYLYASYQTLLKIDLMYLLEHTLRTQNFFRLFKSYKALLYILCKNRYVSIYS